MACSLNRHGGKVEMKESRDRREIPVRRRKGCEQANSYKINGIIHKLEEKYPGFNRRRLKYDDFVCISRAEGITVWEDKIPWEGWYFVRKHSNFIVINDSLPEFDKLFTAFHELGHHFAHGGQSQFYRRPHSRQRKLEKQADIIAAVALVPTPLLEILESTHTLSGEEIARTFKMPKDFGELRLKIFKAAQV